MVDPVSLAIITGASGAAAKSFCDIALGSGRKWIETYFRDHRPKAIEAASANAEAFLAELAARIKVLEESAQVSREEIESAQDHPDFSAVLQKASLAAAQTEDRDKHRLLARLVSDRLKAKPESVIALASKMACDAIAYSNSRQLLLLAFTAVVLYIAPSGAMPPEAYAKWLEQRLSPVIPDGINKLDLLHLEALSCIRTIHVASRSLIRACCWKNQGAFDEQAFIASEVGQRATSAWARSPLESGLTSIGRLLGTYASDELSGDETALNDWGA